MQLALQCLAERVRGPRSPAGEDRYDLALLDTETGRRRPLVGNVTWEPPRWSPDGRRVRFGQRIPGGRFVLREVDVDTGAVEDVADDMPYGSLVPEHSDLARVSPAGRWIVYRHRTAILCVARADGTEAFALNLWPRYFAAAAHWSPCGTMLAADLTPDSGGGPHVIDLRTGDPRPVSPGHGTQADGWPSFHVSGWSPDGSRVVATRSRWHDPDTYDYELNDVWLLAADATAAEPLTDDGRCRQAAIRPTGEASPANGEHELTFTWAHRLRSAADRPAAGAALAAQLRMDPATIVVMVRTGQGLSYPTLAGFRTVLEGFEKLDAFLDANDYRPATDFTIVLPRYAIHDPTILELAHLVAAEARKRLWQFDRDISRFPDPHR